MVTNRRRWKGAKRDPPGWKPQSSEVSLNLHLKRVSGACWNRLAQVPSLSPNRHSCVLCIAFRSSLPRSQLLVYLWGVPSPEGPLPSSSSISPAYLLPHPSNQAQVMRLDNGAGPSSFGGQERGETSKGRRPLTAEPVKVSPAARDVSRRW